MWLYTALSLVWSGLAAQAYARGPAVERPARVRNRVPGTSVTVYLQFDGFDARTHHEIRGRDLRALKQRALDQCAAEGPTVTLVAAVERGLNEHELGATIEFGIDHPAVRSVAFQPVTHSGRHVPFDPLNRLTNPDVIRLISEQLPGWFTKGDFLPVPCCFPTCRSVTYLLVDGEPGNRTVVPIPRLLQVEDYLGYVTHRVLPDDGIREALEKLWSASAFMGTATTEEKLHAAAEALDCAGVPPTLSAVGEPAASICRPPSRT
ncbi:hypothetical protein [Streptomyces sp. HC307]|uniref:hypothetical protein n=1 Tax=Streptomyces flavusporus TaxID=3385496 RepID=UPI0039171B27